ncbi:unnamed protein product [Absidia cylindrospora]
MAAEGRMIHCVKKSLEEDHETLSFVALSYRWGELQEKLVDTQCGYLASITSFALDDFYDLCQLIIKEPDLKSIQYVWVDAICVDQTNDEQRKATIHHMSNIYEKATYILAVPDLHQQHLKHVSHANADVLNTLHDYDDYIYHLIQGNTKELVALDTQFLDDLDVPNDPTLRRLLTTYTHCFMDGFMNQCLPYHLDVEMLVEQLYDISHADVAQTTHADSYASFENNVFCGENKEVPPMHWRMCLAWRGEVDEEGAPCLPWKTHIIKRNNAIRHVMQWLQDLVRDWSTRVWVISEFHLAKTKNNLKYWFTGLTSQWMAGLPFFTFDFKSTPANAASGIVGKTAPIYLQFHETMTSQLITQGFFEKMLNSKAKDRFYAILPQSKYKDNINQVADWHIHTMLSVKLKLFEIMDTKDKLTLLFLAGCEPPSSAYEDHGLLLLLPTFATPTLSKTTFSFFAVPDYPLNFDVANPSTITLDHYLYYSFLQLTPNKYHVLSHPYLGLTTQNYVNPKKRCLCNAFQLDEDSLTMDIVYVSYFDEARASDNCNLWLIGSFVENKWLLSIGGPLFAFNKWDHHDNEDASTVFNIY